MRDSKKKNIINHRERERERGGGGGRGVVCLGERMGEDRMRERG